MYSATLQQIEHQIEGLSYLDRLALMEHLIRTLRTDPPKRSEYDIQLQRMATDPDILREIAAINAEFAVADMDGLKDED